MLWAVTCFGCCVVFVALCRDTSEGTRLPVGCWGARAWVDGEQGLYLGKCKNITVVCCK